MTDITYKTKGGIGQIHVEADGLCVQEISTDFYIEMAKDRRVPKTDGCWQSEPFYKF